MKKYNVYDIDWDVGEPFSVEDCGLPTEAVVEAENENEIAAILSDNYFFSVYGFRIG